jgi:hypothetical protein
VRPTRRRYLSPAMLRGHHLPDVRVRIAVVAPGRGGAVLADAVDYPVYILENMDGITACGGFAEGCRPRRLLYRLLEMIRAFVLTEALRRAIAVACPDLTTFPSGLTDCST